MKWRSVVDLCPSRRFEECSVFIFKFQKVPKDFKSRFAIQILKIRNNKELTDINLNMDQHGSH
jgi:hypothetical protein